MNKLAIDFYRQMFLSLRRGNASGEPSMAKPLFLVSLIESVTSQRSNLFTLNDPILNDYYKTNSVTLTYQKVPSIIVPFFHMHTESFYELVWKSDHRPPNFPHTPSRKTLTPLIEGAKLDSDLWTLLQDCEVREYLRQCIIAHYFDNSQK